MKRIFTQVYEMRAFLTLWFTQSLSGLGSAMTSYALVLWSYGEKGSALVTALLMVCSYAPYVLFSIFAGALSDRWDKKRTMLACDAFAALVSIATIALYMSGALRIWHLYVLNALNGFMNTLQQPASEVATTLLLPKKYYQKVGALKYFSNALQSILTPVIATMVMGLWGIGAVFAFDMCTFFAAFCSLLFLIRLPKADKKAVNTGGFLSSVREGLRYLQTNRGILYLILFFACINLVASMYEAALPAVILSRADDRALGAVNAAVGIAMLAGSIIASFLPAPKSRVRAVMNTLLFSMSFENFLLAFGRSLPVWCIGAFLGWILIPLMNANLSALMRLSIPEDIQGRVYAARNSLQFFTIPVGYFLGGFFVDKVFEPLMAAADANGIFVELFGAGKGSGGAMFYACLAVTGIFVCLIFRKNKAIWELDDLTK
ncbi:MAG: MFS transporter [Clostridia bacterium]|nr:MFS transporter [Clostridia bacterium]